MFLLFNLFGLLLFFLAVGFFLNLAGIVRIPFEQIRSLLPFGGIGLALLITLIILVGTNLRRVSVPLDELLAASNRVADGDYSVRVSERGPSEVRSLGVAFNTMAARLHGHDQQRRAMLADVTHELRTPLTIIQGNLEGVLDGLYPADEARLKSILEETQILSRLTDDLRILALAEGGALQLQREQADLTSLLHETIRAFQAKADQEGVKLDSSLPDRDVILDLDPERIRQVLANLIANALRYSPRGSAVIVRMQVTDDKPQEGALVSVKDNGPGIAPADLPHIFDRYYKTADSHGMGLGLSIAKYIVEAHGGTIKAENNNGSGTTISFTVPG
jgi:signal transduction histidine kinase